jgi:hypothetical protein
MLLQIKLTNQRLVLWGILIILVGVLGWAAVRYLDHTQVAAREYIAQNATIISRVGPIRDVMLYKLRYMNTEGTLQVCFAEYFFFVSGETGSTHLRVLACGAKDHPEFQIREQ